MDPRAVLAALVEDATPGVVGIPSGPLLRLRDRRRRARRGRGRLADLGLGPERGPLRRAARPRPSSRRCAAAGSRSCSACRRTSRSPTSPAARWRTSPRSPRRGTTCSRRPAGTSRRTASPARRRSASSSARSVTSRSTARSACSASAPSSLEVVPVDDQGRMRVDELRLGDGPTIVCGQAGEVNTGAFDDLDAIADVAAEAGAWFHVDGAFGLWAAASPQLRHLLRGSERADSWATDGAQVAERPVRLGPRLLRASGGAPRRDERDRVVSRACGRQARARRGRLDARVLAPRARLPDLRGDPLARPRRASPR